MNLSVTYSPLSLIYAFHTLQVEFYPQPPGIRDQEYVTIVTSDGAFCK